MCWFLTIQSQATIELNFVYNMMYTGGFLTSSRWLVDSAFLLFEIGHVARFRCMIQMLFCDHFKKPYNISLNDLETQLGSYIYLASMVIKIWTCISRWHITYTALTMTIFLANIWLMVHSYHAWKTTLIREPVPFFTL